MRKIYVWFSLVFFLVIFFTDSLWSQVVHNDSLQQFKKLPAGENYKASSLHKFLWGSNYRNLWTTPVTVKTINLDTAFGGLSVTNADTSATAKTLYLVNSSRNLYVLVSVNRMPGKLLSRDFRNTFVENIANDEISITNPYAAATIPVFEKAISNSGFPPDYVFVPKQPALGLYNTEYGNNFYKLIRLPDKYTGSNEVYLTTNELLAMLKQDANTGIDEKTFIRERLLDMFLNDWNSGERQWMWKETINGDKKTFTPSRRDHDAAYTNYNGKITHIGFQLTGLSFIQSFEKDLRKVNRFNFQANDLDRRLLNATTLNEWQTIAEDLQQSITDTLIQNAIAQLPKEIYPLTGNDVVAKLKSRRAHLVEWATTYYRFISKEVEIPGTVQNEIFEVTTNDSETSVHIYTNNNGIKSDTPFYARTFHSSETKEIRLSGLNGADKYSIEGSNTNNIKLKIIDGIQKINKDTIAVNGVTEKVIVYADKNNIQQSTEAPVKFISDTSFKQYSDKWFHYDRTGISPLIFYSREDRLYVELAYRYRHFKWGKMPFASNQVISLHYSLLEHAFSVTYNAIIPKLVAKSDFSLLANYDFVRWTYFFGMGNDTKFETGNSNSYYIMRTRQWVVQPSLSRGFGRNTVRISANVNGLRIINDTTRFLAKEYYPDKASYSWAMFANESISYTYQKFNDPIVPTKGVLFNTTITGSQSLNGVEHNYTDYAATAHFYIPLVSKFSLNIRTGAETISGQPEFYQYPSIGGTILRGFVRDRFRGKTAFWNTNDIRYITSVHTHYFVGKAGLLAFVDDGRVWMPGEQSNTLHVAYGGGIILAPWHFGYADFNYGRSGKEHSIQVRVVFFLP
jgi:hypothetical protein